MSQSTKANLLLILVTIIWGGTFPIIRDALVYITPSDFILYRFLLASLVLLPFVWKKIFKPARMVLLGGLLLGACNYAMFLFQTKGLETVDSSRVAFITGASVVLVPFLSAIFRVGRIRLIDVVSVLLCMVGVYILTGSNLGEVSLGDLWVVACSFFVALTIVVVQWLSMRVEATLVLTFFQIFFVLPFASVTFSHFNLSILANHYVLAAVIYCGAFSAVVTLFLQLKYQKFTTPTKAALIYTLEPVFASYFAWQFNHEAITSSIIWGGVVITISVVLGDFVNYLSGRRGSGVASPKHGEQHIPG